MNRPFLCAHATVVATAALLASMFTGCVARANPPGGPAVAPPSPFDVRVDSRVELLAIIFRLAGAQEYNMRSLPRYAAAIDTFFAPHRAHPAVVEAARLRAAGISHDAVMSLAVHLTDLPHLVEHIPLEGSALDRRWDPADARAFLQQVRAFARDADVESFLAQQQAEVYAVAIRRMRALLDAEVNASWFEAFFGESGAASSRLIVVVAPGNGTWNYGPAFRAPDGREELYSIITVVQTDEDGRPAFSPNVASTVVHEFSHSFVNPVIDAALPELEPAGRAIIDHFGDRMRPLGYPEARHVLAESVVRAAVARYRLENDGEAFARRELQRQRALGFLWIDEVYDLLGEYERIGTGSQTLSDFTPSLVTFFDRMTTRIPEIAAEEERSRPKLVRVEPALESGDIDPATAELTFHFDRPMGSNYALVLGPGGRERFPGGGRVTWNEARTSLTVHVTLQPEWDYEFSLNAPGMSSFMSAEGIALRPVPIRFRTGEAR
jgi:hypothetical protein